MSNLTITNLENCFRSAIDSGYNYVAVRIQIEGFPTDEIIINPLANAEDKLAYYKNAYNENLTHKQVGANIRIVGFTFGDTFEDIEDDFYEKMVASKIILKED